MKRPGISVVEFFALEQLKTRHNDENMKASWKQLHTYNSLRSLCMRLVLAHFKNTRFNLNEEGTTVGVGVFEYGNYLRDAWMTHLQQSKPNSANALLVSCA